jgi:magnesium transporter
MRAVIGSLEPRVRRFTSMNMEDYFGDMVDHVDKIWDGLDEYKEIIEGLNDTHDSLATNRTNEVVRTLTIIATVLLPITVVSSIYGMNIEHLPWADGPYAFPIVVLIMVVIIGLMLYFFRRKHVI